MKITLTVVAALLSFASYSQPAQETIIRQLENDMKLAFLKRDTVLMVKLLSPQFVVNSPYNRVSTFEDVMNGLRKGGADTLTFEKTIEKITFTNNIAIVMGQESRTAKGEAMNAGKTFQRRFTDVWMNNRDNWQLVARQSTLFLTQ